MNSNRVSVRIWGCRWECEIEQIIVSHFGEKGDFVAGCAGFLHLEQCA